MTELRAKRHDRWASSVTTRRQGAKLGSTSLLVSEDDGEAASGGADRGGPNLTLVGFEFVAIAAPGPLVVNDVVAGALVATRTLPERSSGNRDT